jgi:hypothetical protein
MPVRNGMPRISVPSPPPMLMTVIARSTDRSAILDAVTRPSFAVFAPHTAAILGAVTPDPDRTGSRPCRARAR